MPSLSIFNIALYEKLHYGVQMKAKKPKSKATAKTKREVACRRRTPETEQYYKDYFASYMRDYRAKKKAEKLADEKKGKRK